MVWKHPSIIRISDKMTRDMIPPRYYYKRLKHVLAICQQETTMHLWVGTYGNEQVRNLPFVLLPRLAILFAASLNVSNGPVNNHK